MLKRNVIINYFSQLYLALLNIAVVPIYLKLLGSETFGLIGIFITAQGLMQILDVGLSATLSREATKFSINPQGGAAFRKIFDKVFKFFLCVSMGTALLLLVFAKRYSLEWFKYKSLEPREILVSVSLIAIIIALRFLVSPFRSILLGLEKHVWLNAFILITGTLKYFGIIPIVIFVSKSPEAFFVYEFCIAILEAILIMGYTFRLLPKKSLISENLNSDLMKEVITFSLSIGLTSIIWILLSQVDRIALSKILPLAQYGYFSAVVTAASGILILSSPLSRALLPRMTALVEQRKINDLVDLYRKSTQVVALIIVPIGLLIMAFSRELLWLWTANRDLALYGQRILFWYALGYTATAIAAFPYYLQYAYGQLKIHIWANLISFVIGIPIIIFAAIKFGALGTGIIWAALQISYLVLGTYFVHKKFLSGFHWKWLFWDVLPGYSVGLVIYFFKLNGFVDLSLSKPMLVLRLLLVGAIVSLFLLALRYLLKLRSVV